MSVDSVLTHKGETLPIAEWARRTGIKDKTIYMRIREGWTVQDALEKPLQKKLFARDPTKKNRKADEARAEEREQIREWARTQPAEVDERREEGDIL